MAFVDDFPSDGLEVIYSEFLIATADGGDELVDGSVPEVLRLLREHMKMDVVFVSEFANGQRVLRHVDAAPGKAVIEAGQSDPLEASWCQRVVEGRLPEFIGDAAALPESAPLIPEAFPIGTHMSTPIVLKDGTVYGTLCCFSFAPSPTAKAHDLRKLKYTAQLTATKIEQQAAR